MEYVTLANGVRMPQLGYGVYQVTREECERCVADALSVGYRHIDTAQSYFNEEEVGKAVKNSGISRAELFITTKVWIEHYAMRNAESQSWNRCVNCSSIISTSFCCISRLQITTAHGERWRSCMRRANCAPSAFPTSIQTGWWTFVPFRASNLWSIRWRRIRTINRKPHTNG